MNDRSAKRDAVLQLLAAPIMKELGGGGVKIGWILLALIGAGGLAWCGIAGLGVVTTVWSSHGIPILIPWFVSTVFVITGLLRANFGARAPTGWAPGRYLLAEGFVDARSEELRTRSIADLTRIEVKTGAPGPSGMSLYTVEAWFGAACEKFLVFGTERNVPRARLDELPARRDALLAGRKNGQGDPLAEWAASSPRPRRRLADFSWRVGAIAGVVVAALLHLVVFPSLSLSRAVAGGRIEHLRAVRNAFSFPWITGRADAAIHARFADAHARTAARLSVDKRAPLDRILDQLERSDGGVIRCELSSPDGKDFEAATAWLQQRARLVPGSKPAPVILGYQVVSLAGTVIGERQLCDGLARRMEEVIPRDIATLEIGRRDDSDPDPKEHSMPAIAVRSSSSPVTTYQVEGARLYAGLAYSFEAQLRIEGQPPAPLAAPVTIPPPLEFSVGRMTFNKEKLAPLGSSGDAMLDRMDDSLVYNQVAEQAASAAITPLADQIFGPQ